MHQNALTFNAKPLKEFISAIKMNLFRQNKTTKC